MPPSGGKSRTRLHTEKAQARRSCPLCPPRPADSYHSGSRSTGAEPGHAGRAPPSPRPCTRAPEPAQQHATNSPGPHAQSDDTPAAFCRACRSTPPIAATVALGSTVPSPSALTIPSPAGGGGGGGGGAFSPPAPPAAPPWIWPIMAIIICRCKHAHSRFSRWSRRAAPPPSLRAPLESTREQCMLTGACLSASAGSQAPVSMHSAHSQAPADSQAPERPRRRRRQHPREAPPHRLGPWPPRPCRRL